MSCAPLNDSSSLNVLNGYIYLQYFLKASKERGRYAVGRRRAYRAGPSLEESRSDPPPRSGRSENGDRARHTIGGWVS
jgi:hypothetical protein